MDGPLESGYQKTFWCFVAEMGKKTPKRLGIICATKYSAGRQLSEQVAHSGLANE